MAVKTISLKADAYDRLRGARRYPSESFSEIVMRARWPEDTITAKELLERCRSGRPWFTDAELERVEEVKRNSQPPEDKWGDS
jgi:predicted CopG family antitoxin